ncbi:MAG: dipeptidyl-peptidase 4, partial [Actinomycetota bacterium]|nr:dipeptidyl-peptidase 4 [Actinomycetota bacterium]
MPGRVRCSAVAPQLTFPRQSARTRGFSLGVPRSFRVADDGSRVVFLRSASGRDPLTALWVLDVGAGVERLVADPRDVLEGEAEDLPGAERARRERTREQAGGFVAYDTDPACTTAVAALGGRLVLVDLVEGRTRVLDAQPGAFDPRLSPTGRHVAYVDGLDLRVLHVGGEDRVVSRSDDPEVSWGSAEFVAAEEMGRSRGHWWSPDGERLAVARVDVSPVDRWHIADLAEPRNPPAAIRYPAAGGENARVGLWTFGLDGTDTPIRWDDTRFPYLVSVDWSASGLLLAVESRDQRTMDVLLADPAGGTTSLRRQEDATWVDIVPGTPTFVGGRLVTAENAGGARRLTVDGVAVTPAGLQVRSVVSGDDDSGDVLLNGSEDDPTVVHVYRVNVDG